MRRPALVPTVLAISPFTTARWRTLPTCSTQYRPGLASPPPILVWWPFPAFSTPSTSQSPLTLWNHYGSESGRGFNSSKSAITRHLAIPTTPPSQHFVHYAVLHPHVEGVATIFGSASQRIVLATPPHVYNADLDRICGGLAALFSHGEESISSQLLQDLVDGVGGSRRLALFIVSILNRICPRLDVPPTPTNIQNVAKITQFLGATTFTEGASDVWFTQALGRIALHSILPLHCTTNFALPKPSVPQLICISKLVLTPEQQQRREQQREQALIQQAQAQLESCHIREETKELERPIAMAPVLAELLGQLCSFQYNSLMAPTHTKKFSDPPPSPPSPKNPLTPPPTPKKPSRPKKIKWYLDQRGHMLQSQQDLRHIPIQKLMLPAYLGSCTTSNSIPPTPRAKIFSANTIPELVALLPQCLHFEGGVDLLQSTDSIFYAVHNTQQIFLTFDAAAELWADTRKYHPNSVTVVTPDHDYAYWFGGELEANRFGTRAHLRTVSPQEFLPSSGAATFTFWCGDFSQQGFTGTEYSCPSATSPTKKPAMFHAGATFPLLIVWASSSFTWNSSSCSSPDKLEVVILTRCVLNFLSLIVSTFLTFETRATIWQRSRLARRELGVLPSWPQQKLVVLHRPSRKPKRPREKGFQMPCIIDKTTSSELTLGKYRNNTRETQSPDG
ncbi:hypothetical protein B0H14DRAFT_2649126 [Mycena olivaceomarginata]|nr:hypothetical protein B0H14DRAFT_2649126 [Mycena olivaceomarginata]